MLHGVRVIELGTTITAPLTAMLLADLGADVIKVERPEGDPFRTFRGTGSPYFAAFNRNKRSVVLDLAAPAEQTKLRALLSDADVFLDNVRPAVLPRLGLEPAALRTANPRLIHCSITGFGATGPASARPAFDAVAQAVSGMSSLSLDPDAPNLSGPTLSDNITGMYACIAILGALARRGATGQGCRLEVNMLEATMAFIGDQFTGAMQLGHAPGRFSRVAGSQSYAFTCADGGIIAIHLSSLDKFWTALLDVVAAPELGTDNRFSTRAGRIDHYLELRDALAARFARADRATWIERLTAADVPFAPVHNLFEALDDPQVRALGTVYRQEGPDGEALVGINPPILLDGRRPAEMGRAPRLGEHTDELCGAASQRG